MLVKVRDGTQSLNAVSKEHGIEVSTVTPCLSARGEAADLHIEICGRVWQPIARIDIAIEIKTLDGAVVSRISSNLSGSALVNLSGEWQGLFTVPNITHRLSSGDYVLRLMVYRPQVGLELSIDDATVVHIPHSASPSLGSPYLFHYHGLLPPPTQFTSPNLGSADD